MAIVCLGGCADFHQRCPSVVEHDATRTMCYSGTMIDPYEAGASQGQVVAYVVGGMVADRGLIVDIAVCACRPLEYDGLVTDGTLDALAGQLARKIERSPRQFVVVSNESGLEIALSPPELDGTALVFPFQERFDFAGPRRPIHGHGWDGVVQTVRICAHSHRGRLVYCSVSENKTLWSLETASVPAVILMKSVGPLSYPGGPRASK